MGDDADDTKATPSADAEAERGWGTAPCSESQADGVPCPDLTGDCETCPRGKPAGGEEEDDDQEATP